MKAIEGHLRERAERLKAAGLTWMSPLFRHLVRAVTRISCSRAVRVPMDFGVALSAMLYTGGVGKGAGGPSG